MRYEGRLTPNVYIPFFNISIALNWPLYMVFAAFVVVGTVNAVKDNSHQQQNERHVKRKGQTRHRAAKKQGTCVAVNITDGLDGLSTSVSIPVALFFVSAATSSARAQNNVDTAVNTVTILISLHPHISKW